jgi:hypothetical protein
MGGGLHFRFPWWTEWIDGCCSGGVRSLGEVYKSCSSFLQSFLHLPITSSLFSPNILLSTLFSNTLSLCPSLNVRDQVRRGPLSPQHSMSSCCRWWVTVNIFNKKPWTNDKGWSSSMWLGVGLTTPHHKKIVSKSYITTSIYKCSVFIRLVIPCAPTTSLAQWHCKRSNSYPKMDSAFL